LNHLHTNDEPKEYKDDKFRLTLKFYQFYIIDEPLV